MKKNIAFLIILLLPYLAGYSEEKKRIKLTDLPDSLSEFCVTDGSSLYIFSQDGSFRLEPLNSIGGRIIEGEWRNDPSHDIRLFTITGEWKWINGMYTPDDMREMELLIGTLWDQPTEHKSVFSSDVYQIYDSYLLINRIEKIEESLAQSKESNLGWLVTVAGLTVTGLLGYYVGYQRRTENVNKTEVATP